MVHIAPQYGTYRKVIRGILASRFVFFVKSFEFADERFFDFLLFWNAGNNERCPYLSCGDGKMVVGECGNYGFLC